jgi:hypothetical protein
MRHPVRLVVFSVLAAGLIVGCSWLAGHWLMQPGPRTADRLHALGETLTHGGVPETFSEWEASESDELSQAVLPSGLAGHATYVYRHAWTNRTVMVHLVWGPSRAIAACTPAGWYPKGGFRLDAGPKPLTVVFDESRVELLTAVFVKEEEKTLRRLRVSWTSSDDGPWLTSHLSLTNLDGSRPVVKVYLISDAPTAEGDEADPTIEFARGFFSELTRSLAPSTPST